MPLERRRARKSESFRKEALKFNLEKVVIMPMPPGEVPSWMEQCIWTEKMIATLRNGGPKGGKWAHRLWPNQFFHDLELFSLKEAHIHFRNSCRGNR